MVSFALYNSKGGVGKTASAVNLAFLAAQNKNKVLIWDLDPQASTTFYYQIKAKVKGGVKKLVDGKHDISKYIKSTSYENIDILPADFSTRNLDLILDDMKKSKKRLKSVIKDVAKEYDYVFIDSHPGFSVLSENIFIAADYVIIPMIPTILSVRTYEQIIKYFKDDDLSTNKIMPFFAMVDRRKKMHKEILEKYITEDSHFLKNSIPYSSVVEKMGDHQAPLPAYSKRTKAAIAYVELWNEIENKVKKK